MEEALTEVKILDIPTLKLLEEDDVRALVKPFGIMLKFRTHWRKWKEEMVLNEPPQNSDLKSSSVLERDCLLSDSFGSLPSTSFEEEINSHLDTSCENPSLPQFEAVAQQSVQQEGVTLVGVEVQSQPDIDLSLLLGFHEDYLFDDFEKIYPDHGQCLFNGVHLIREKLIKLALEKKQNTRDETLKILMSEVLSAASDTGTPCTQVATLLLLPYLLNTPHARKLKKDNTWKPSRSEVRGGFITHLKCESLLVPTIEERKLKMENMGLTLQPTIFIVGPSISVISKSVVVVNVTIYKFNTPIEAVDGAFKIFHATGAFYPTESVDIWMFIQRAIFKISTDFDMVSQSLRHLASNVGLEL